MNAFADDVSISGPSQFNDGQLIPVSMDDLDDIAGAGWRGRADAIGGAFAGGAIMGYSSGYDHKHSIGYGVGAAVAAGSSGASSGRVICTHFYRKGMLDRETWRADLEFTATRLSPRTVRGYQYWAIPYVRLMRRSPLAERIMYPLAKWRAEELSYRMGNRTKGNLKGKVVRLIGESICYSIGLFVGEQDWQKLWTEEGAKA